MTNEEILANAPEGATEIWFGLYESVGDYAKITKSKGSVLWDADEQQWYEDSLVDVQWVSRRSLSDIRRIVELEKQVQVSNEIMDECWAMVGNDIDYELGGYDTLHEHVNALKEHAEAAERERDEFKGAYILLDGLKRRIRSAFEFWPDLAMHKDLSCLLNLKASQDMVNKFAIEQKIDGVFKFSEFLESSHFSSAIAVKESNFSKLAEIFANQLRQQLNGENQ